MPNVTDRRGFAIPVTVLLVALLTVMLTAGFTRLQVDRQIAAGTSATQEALAIAQSGLQTYLGTLNIDACVRPVRPVDNDSVRINVPGGYAWVHAHVAQKPADTLGTWLYIIRSTGSAIEASIGPDPRARRTVAQFARWQQGSLKMPAVWTAAEGIDGKQNGNATGEFRGVDQAPAGCRDPDVTAIRTPSGLSPADLSGFTLSGNSPYVLAAGSRQQVADSTYIDWNAVVNGGIAPDYTSPQLWDWTYSVQLITGNLTIGDPSSSDVGTGLLIVTGDLHIHSAFFQWYGAILVGGKIHLGADDQRFDGYVASGLKAQLGLSVGKTKLGEQDDYTDMDFNSLFVRASLNGLSGWVPVGNTWMDDWASY